MAAVTSAGGSIGAQAGSTGVVTLASGGSWTSSAGVTVGGAGTGTLKIGAASGQAVGAPGVFSAPSVSMGTNGRIVLNHTDVSGTYAFAAPMSGTGSVRHENGFTVLTGVSTYSGATAVTGGTLAVDGAIGSSVVTVSGPGFLIGNGTVGGIAAGSGATVAPWRSIGTLNVSGNVSFAPGSTYEVEIEPSGTGDLILATGTATLSGGTVVLIPAPGTYGVQTYTIVSAAGGVTGAFDALDTPEFAFVTPRLDYTSTTVDLVFEPTVPIETLGVTPNQKATAQGVASLGGGNPVFDAVLFSPATADALMALDALSGEVHASATSAGIEDARWVREAVLDRLRWGARGGAPGTGVWAQGLGAWGDLDSDGNAAAMTTTSQGFIMGADAVRDGAFRLGVAGGMTKTWFDVDDRRSSGDTTSGFGAIYGGASVGAFTLRGGVSAGVRSIETGRDVIFTGFADRTEAVYGGYTVQGFGEAGYEMASGAAALEPFAGLSLVRVGADSFVEEGGDAALEGDAMAQDLATSILALRGSVALNGAGDAAPVVRGLVGWLHAFGDIAPEADLAFAAGSTGFTVWGVPVAEDALAAQAAFDWALNGSFTAGFEYSGQIAADVQSHAVKANVAVAF